MKAPNSEQVAVGWLNALPLLDAPAATNRPAGTGWSATGFVVVSVVGSAARPDATDNAPIVSLDCWAVAAGSGQPPWAHAAGIAQIIREYAKTWTGSVDLDTSPGYNRARVASAWPVTEIRRIPEPDGSSYAHYSLDIGLRWVEVPTV